MSEIPEDVWLAAISALDGHAEVRIIEVIARAILAENERCAKIAESIMTPYPQAKWMRQNIADAIRRR